MIGSGATAIALIPALAERAGKVTMLQRSPTYIVSASKFDKVAAVSRKVLPHRPAHAVIRMYSALTEAVLWFFARKTPGFIKWTLRRKAVKSLPDGYDVDTHFKPRYQPWDQRLCLIPDADLYTAISDGRAEVVTAHIDHFDATGIALKSGGHLDADIIVTATGLRLQALGGASISLDGTEINHRDRFVYKAHMLEDVPNLFWCVGYTNASWTLRADMTARGDGKAVGAHGLSRPHARLPTPRQRADGRKAVMGHSGQLCEAVAARAAQVAHQAAVECAAELLRRRHRLPVRPRRGGDGVRPRR